MCLTQKSYDPYVHFTNLCRMMVKKLPKILEYFDANKDILSDNEGHYLEMMDRFKVDYDTCKEWGEIEKNHWKKKTHFEEGVEVMDKEIDELYLMHRYMVKMVEKN